MSIKFLKANLLIFHDIYNALLLRKIWSAIALKTMFVKYKRSKLGFLWPFVNSFLFSIIIAIVFSSLLNQNFKEYAPYLISGFIIWNFFSAIISEQTTVITENNSFLKELNYDIFFYIFKKSYELIFTFIINILIFLLLSELFFHQLSLKLYLLLINIPLIILLSIFVSYVLCIIHCFFRDFVFIVNNIMRLLFFVTPILWTPEKDHGIRSLFSTYNPFYYLVEMIRAPLISAPLVDNIYLVYVFLLLFFYLTSIFLYKIFHNKIVFYL